MQKALAIFLICIVFACGCVQTPETDQTQIPTQSPAETTEETLQEIIPSETQTAEASPFPDALNLKEKYSYGDEVNGRIIAVDDAWIENSYWFHSVAHGYDWEFKPRDGNKFVFIELWVKHNGTSRELGAPPSGSLNLWYDGNFYSSLEEREGATAKITKPYNLWDDYYGGSIGRYEKREGFLIYEVPESITLDAAYIQANLGNMYEAPVWKLG
ncbi:MAG: hypothetical protein JXQ82_01490 [Methanomicrobiaceae archaeon]|nr:hypothetical protein [Methanomicrobiaceae archaeon]